MTTNNNTPTDAELNELSTYGNPSLSLRLVLNGLAEQSIIHYDDGDAKDWSNRFQGFFDTLWSWGSLDDALQAAFGDLGPYAVIAAGEFYHHYNKVKPTAKEKRPKKGSALLAKAKTTLQTGRDAFRS